jgi:signal peptidase
MEVSQLNNSQLSSSKKIPMGSRLADAVQALVLYLIAIFIIIAAILFAMDKSPQKSLFGYRYYTVLTPSMTPSYQVGDIVVVRTGSISEIQEGDVITFNPSSDGETYLTHRVTQIFTDYEGTGETCFKTKGDANDAEDNFVIDSGRVIGKVIFHVPKVGYLIRFVQLKWYFVVPLVVLLLIWIKLLKLYSEAVQKETKGGGAGQS